MFVIDIVERQVSLKMSLPETQAPDGKIPAWQQFAGLTLRSVFLVALAVLTFRVALPQNETIATAYDTPNDLIRLALGFAVCGWLVFELFRLPRDAGGYRSWLYIGAAGVPFALVCLYYAW
jgi:TRAP-type C4-dicarboxylate transport system permease small subunit